MLTSCSRHNVGNIARVVDKGREGHAPCTVIDGASKVIDLVKGTVAARIGSQNDLGSKTQSSSGREHKR